jgi:hypothetical protein
VPFLIVRNNDLVATTKNMLTVGQLVTADRADVLGGEAGAEAKQVVEQLDWTGLHPDAVSVLHPATEEATDHFTDAMYVGVRPVGEAIQPVRDVSPLL